jgi:hypothetical protein
MPNRRTFVALAASAAALLAAPAFALGRLVDVEIVDRGRNEALPTHTHRGTEWVAGRPGGRYAVRLVNRTGGRVLVVLSIDGVNAVSGETASTGQRGYVLGPWQAAEIAGWRKNLSETAAFYFTALADSYAARTDRPDNVGVIGTAVFREKPREVSRREHWRPDADASSTQNRGALSERRREADAPAAFESSRSPSTAAAGATAPPAASPGIAPSAERKAAAPVARDERLGTGHGEREYAPAEQTAFERASERPAEVVRIRYDSVDNLVALGIVRAPLAPPTPRPRAPDPFPAFVPDPNS